MDLDANADGVYVSDTDSVHLKHVCRLKGSGRKVLSVATPPEGSIGKFAVVVVTASSIESWTPSEVATYTKKRVGKPSEGLCGAALSAEGHLTTTSVDGSARVWGVESGSNKVIAPSSGAATPKGQRGCLALSHDGGMVVFGGSDGAVTIRNAQGRLVNGGRIAAHKDRITSITCSPGITNPFFAAGTTDGVVKLFSLRTMKCTHTLKCADYTSKITSVIVSPDGSLCATGAKSGIMNVWDAGIGKFLYQINFHSSIAEMCFSPVRYWLCAACEDGIKILDLESKVMFSVKAPPVANEDDEEGTKPCRACTSLCWSADGSTLYAGYANGDSHVFHVSKRD